MSTRARHVRWWDIAPYVADSDGTVKWSSDRYARECEAWDLATMTAEERARADGYTFKLTIYPPHPLRRQGRG